MSERTALVKEDNKNNDEASRKKFLIGITGALGCTFASVTGIACIQVMDQIPPDFELTVFRFTIGLIFVYLSAKQRLPRIERTNVKWMVAVSLFCLSYNIFTFNHFLKSITFVGIQGIQTSMLIVFSLILSKIFLEVKISGVKGMTAIVVLCGLGVILAAQYIEDRSCVEEQKNQSHTVYKMANASTLLENTTVLNTKKSMGLNTSVTTLKEKSMCVPTSGFVIGVSLVSLGAFATCLDALTVSGATLIKENTIVVSFWEFVVGIAVSLVISLVFEKATFPDNLRDILLLVGHGVSASSVTYFDILAVQNIDLNLYYITLSIILPLSLLLQLTVLHSVNPHANLAMLISGMVVIFACALFLPVYEYFDLYNRKAIPENMVKDNKCQNQK